jgi:hypothetical protein
MACAIFKLVSDEQIAQLIPVLKRYFLKMNTEKRPLPLSVVIDENYLITLNKPNKRHRLSRQEIFYRATAYLLAGVLLLLFQMTFYAARTGKYFSAEILEIMTFTLAGFLGLRRSLNKLHCCITNSYFGLAVVGLVLECGVFVNDIMAWYSVCDVIVYVLYLLQILITVTNFLLLIECVCCIQKAYNHYAVLFSQLAMADAHLAHVLNERPAVVWGHRGKLMLFESEVDNCVEP